MNDNKHSGDAALLVLICALVLPLVAILVSLLGSMFTPTKKNDFPMMTWNIPSMYATAPTDSDPTVPTVSTDPTPTVSTEPDPTVSTEPDPTDTDQTDPDPVNIDPAPERGYYGRQLDGIEQEYYDMIKKAVEEQKDSVTIDKAIDDTRMQAIIDSVYYDFPELFWLENVFAMTDYGATQHNVQLYYNELSSDAGEIQQQIDAEVSDILNELQGKSDYEKVKGVYEYLVLSAEYNDERRPEQSMVPVLLDKEGVCASYAKSTSYLLHKLGVESVYVVGETEDDSHAWNIVQIDGEWYHVDTTWGDPIGESADYITYNYLCLTSEELLRTRTFDAELPIPDCTATTYDYFRMNGLYVDSYDAQAVTDYLLRQSAGDGTFYIKFADPEDYTKALNEVMNGQDIANKTNRRFAYKYWDDLCCITGSFR